MFCLYDPERTRFDWCFRLLGTEVRVHPFFWLTTLLIGGDQGNPWFTIYWVAIVFVSLLVHEFGHVLAMRLAGDRGHIVLWGFGGLAISGKNNYRRHCFTDVAVCAAGPAAGLLLAFLVAAISIAAGGSSRFTFSSVAIPVWNMDFSSLRFAASNYRAYVHVYFVVNTLLYVNFFWSLFNLLPVFPLDGGQITRAILEQRDPELGRMRALRISIGVAVFFAGLACLAGHMSLMYLLAFCAISSLQAAQDGGRVRRKY
jgi:stage IV sporulation protein FB